MHSKCTRKSWMGLKQSGEEQRSLKTWKKYSQTGEHLNRLEATIRRWRKNTIPLTASLRTWRKGCRGLIPRTNNAKKRNLWQNRVRFRVKSHQFQHRWWTTGLITGGGLWKSFSDILRSFFSYSYSLYMQKFYFNKKR